MYVLCPGPYMHEPVSTSCEHYKPNRNHFISLVENNLFYYVSNMFRWSCLKTIFSINAVRVCVFLFQIYKNLNKKLTILNHTRLNYITLYYWLYVNSASFTNTFPKRKTKGNKKCKNNCICYILFVWGMPGRTYAQLWSVEGKTGSNRQARQSVGWEGYRQLCHWEWYCHYAPHISEIQQENP